MEELRGEVVGYHTTSNTSIEVFDSISSNPTELNEAGLTSVRNRGELAEGWYDPSTREKAIESSKEPAHVPKNEDYKPQDAQPHARQQDARPGDDSSDDDVVGPALPSNEPRRRGHGGRRAGPAIPNLQELELQRGILQTTVYVITHGI